MIRHLPRLLLTIGILIAVAPRAFSETRTISWDPVTTYTDGTPIESGKTVVYSAYWTTDPGLGSLHTIGTSVPNASTTLDPDGLGMTRGGTVYFTAKAVLNTGEASPLSPAYAWVVPLVTPPSAVLPPAAPKNMGISGPISSGASGTWRVAWDPVTSYANDAPLDPGRSIHYTAYWTDDPAFSAGSLRQLASSISATAFDFNPTDKMMAKNQTTYLTVRAILDTGGESSLAAALQWVAANDGPKAPAGGSIRKK